MSIVMPVALETSGVFGRDALGFISDIARRTRALTMDPLSYLKLCQQFSVRIQNFNCASILGYCPP